MAMGGLLLLFPNSVMEKLTSRSTFFTYGTFCFSMFVFVWFFVPETKGLSLEKMDDLFGVTDTKTKDVFDADPEARGDSDVDGKNTTTVHEEKVRQ
jgi:hypothetical protein